MASVKGVFSRHRHLTMISSCAIYVAGHVKISNLKTCRISWETLSVYRKYHFREVRYISSCGLRKSVTLTYSNYNYSVLLHVATKVLYTFASCHGGCRWGAKQTERISASLSICTVALFQKPPKTQPAKKRFRQSSNGSKYCVGMEKLVFS